MNSIRLLLKAHHFTLFTERYPLESTGKNILDPILKSKASNQFIVVIKDRFFLLNLFLPVKRSSLIISKWRSCINWYSKTGLLICLYPRTDLNLSPSFHNARVHHLVNSKWFHHDTPS